MGETNPRDSRVLVRLHDEMTEWCRGRWWVFRVVLLVWFAYLLVRLLASPAYSPVFHALDLGIHELGHVIWSPLGEFMGFLGGSLTQCVLPLASIYMFYRQRDFFAMAFCLGWFGVNVFDVSVYVADARALALPLVSPFGGDPMHDWHYLLGRLGILHWDRALGMLLRIGGTLSIVSFLAMGVYQVTLMMRLPGPPSPEEAFETEAAEAVRSRDF